MRFPFIFVLTTVLAAGFIGAARANSDIGVVVLHGTQGRPGSRADIGFESALKSAGYAVATPEMCWSRDRIYDAPYAECLREIDTAIAKLRAAGANRIVLAGQSMGGNAVLSYAAAHPGLAGVIAMAPASDPRLLNRNPSVRQSVDKAKAMVAAGHGNDRASFTSNNNGRAFSVTTTAAIFLSFVDPDGPAVFARILPKVTEPVLWVAGTADQTQSDADAEFASLPANKLNRMVHFNGPHLGTPDAAVAPALEWLRGL